jgi:hypothetical protein
MSHGYFLFMASRDSHQQTKAKPNVAAPESLNPDFERLAQRMGSSCSSDWAGDWASLQKFV